MNPSQKNLKKLLENPDPLVVGATGTGALIVAFAAAIGGWIGYSALKIPHATNLPFAIDTERHTFVSPTAGALSYYQSRANERVADSITRPLVLIHSINAAGSSYEMRPIFEQYRTKRTVYSLDLPGFGFSDRGRRVYSPALYTQAIIDFISTQVASSEPVDAVALSLGSEFLARAAVLRPDLFRSLTLISPSGLYSRKTANGSQKASQNNTSDSLYRAFSFPLWSQALYDLIATPVSIRYFLKGSFEGKIDPGLLKYAYFTAHQPGAKNAPLYFISGKLFSADIFEAIYSKLTMPVLVIYDRDAFVKFDRLPELTTPEHANWHATRIVPTKGLPQFERLADTVAALDGFWSEIT
jgi:pimeloyl-ACP methyl ester carboxylesterase